MRRNPHDPVSMQVERAARLEAAGRRTRARSNELLDKSRALIETSRRLRAEAHQFKKSVPAGD